MRKKGPLESRTLAREPLPHSVDHPPPRKPAGSVIGSTLTIKGEVSGSGDLLAREIRIEGSGQGTVQGEEKIRLSKTASVQGKLVATQIVLEEGFRFWGRIRMGGIDKSCAEAPLAEGYPHNPMEDGGEYAIPSRCRQCSRPKSAWGGSNSKGPSRIRGRCVATERAVSNGRFEG